MTTEIPRRADRALEREFPQADSLASDCVINLWRTHAMISEVMGRLLRPHDLTLTGFRVLMMLRTSPGTTTPAEIADRLGSARATVTGVLDSLEKRGLVRRRPHPDDGRRLQVQISDRARDLLDGLLPAYFTRERETVAALGPERQEQLVQLLGDVQRGLVDVGSDG